MNRRRRRKSEYSMPILRLVCVAAAIMASGSKEVSAMAAAALADAAFGLARPAPVTIASVSMSCGIRRIGELRRHRIEESLRRELDRNDRVSSEAARHIVVTTPGVKAGSFNGRRVLLISGNGSRHRTVGVSGGAIRDSFDHYVDAEFGRFGGLLRDIADRPVLVRRHRPINQQPATTSCTFPVLIVVLTLIIAPVSGANQTHVRALRQHPERCHEA